MQQTGEEESARGGGYCGDRIIIYNRLAKTTVPLPVFLQADIVRRPTTSQMEPVTNGFRLLVSPSQLHDYAVKYRDAASYMLEYLPAILQHGGLDTFGQTYGSVAPCCGQQLGSGEAMVTGSTIEGTSLARFFHPDYDRGLAKDSCDLMEMDLMMPVGVTFDVASSSSMIHRCADGEDLFTHVELDADGVERHRGIITDMDSIARSNGTARYMLSHSAFKQNSIAALNSGQMTGQSDSVLFVHGGGQRDAAITAQTGTKKPCPTRTDELIRWLVDFKRQADEKITGLESIQREFVELRIANGDAPPTAELIDKAEEWLKTAVECAEFVFDVQVEAGYRLVYETLGFPRITGPIDETRRLFHQLAIDPFVIKFRDIRLTREYDPTADERMHRLLNRFNEYFFEIPRVSLCLKAIYEPIEWIIELSSDTEFDELQRQLVEHDQAMDEIKEYAGRCSLDIVSFLTCLFWPDVAIEWAFRQRMWPATSTVADIVRSGVHLIPKGKRHADIDWRWSFSFAEMRIAELWTADQLFVYFVFKSIFYRFIKPLNPKQEGQEQPNYFPSYLAKTVMMWTSERFPQSWWCEYNHGECLTVLLTCLMSAFECRRLDHYFISSANLLSGIPRQMTDRAADVLRCLLNYPQSAVDRMENTFKLVSKLLRVAESLLWKTQMVQSKVLQPIAAKLRLQRTKLLEAVGKSPDYKPRVPPCPCSVRQR